MELVVDSGRECNRQALSRSCKDNAAGAELLRT